MSTLPRNRRAHVMGEVIGPFDVLLVLGVLFAAGFALFGRPRIHAAAMFLVFGVLLSVVWAWLSAPDVAIAEAALGAGVTGVLIMNAVTATGAAPPPGEPPSAVGTDDGDSSSEADTGRARSGSVRSGEQRTFPQRLYAVVAGVFAGVLALGLVAVVWRMRPVPGVGGEVGENLASSGVSHPVTAVLLNFRSYD